MPQTNLQSLAIELRALGAALPRGSRFRFTPEGGDMHLEELSIPAGHRGIGTAFLARVVAAADRLGCPTTLHADPTDKPGDPCTFELVRWYARFGYVATGLSTEDWVGMRREPREDRGGPEAILRDYARATEDDLTRESFDAMMEAFYHARRHPGP